MRVRVEVMVGVRGMHEAEGGRESHASQLGAKVAGGDGVAWCGGVGEATRRSQMKPQSG